jgi:hypothetical protein
MNIAGINLNINRLILVASFFEKTSHNSRCCVRNFSTVGEDTIQRSIFPSIKAKSRRRMRSGVVA